MNKRQAMREAKTLAAWAIRQNLDEGYLEGMFDEKDEKKVHEALLILIERLMPQPRGRR